MNKIFSNSWFWLVVILLTTFFSYFSILSFDFVYWDDDKQILNNIYVKIINWEHIKHNFFSERFTFIPLTLYSIIYHFFADNAMVYHLASVLIHLLNVWSVFKLLKKLNFSDTVVIGSLLLFALHPLRIESVAWISEWKDLIFTFFYICGLFFYISWINNNKFLFLIVYILMAWLAGFSKIQGVLLPFSCILLDYFLLKRIRLNAIVFNLSIFVWVLLSPNFKIWYSVLFISSIVLLNYKKYLRQKLSFIFKPWGLIAAFSIVLIFAFFYKWLWFWTGSSDFSLTDRIVFSGYSLFFYIQQFIFPLKQIAIHQYPTYTGVELWKEWGGYMISWLIIIILIFILIKSSFRNKHWILFGVLFFLLNISIVLHFIPIEGRLIVAERYSYLAYLGLILALTLLVEDFLKNKLRLKPIVLIVFLFLLSIITINRTSIWRNTESLFKDVVLKEPATSFAWVNLGSFYLEKKEYDYANFCYSQAEKYNPNDLQIYLNQALSNFALNNISFALKNINEGIRRSNNDEDLSMFFVTKGQIYEQIGEFDSAFNYYNKALIKYSKNFKAHLQKSLLFAKYIKIRNIDSALYYAQKAISINQYYADAYHTLGWLYLTKNDIDHSIFYIKKSIELNPKYPLAYNSLGYISMIQNNLNDAIELYSKAIMLDSSLIEVIKNRAWVYFQTKQFSLALSDYKRALFLAPNDYIALENTGFCLTYSNKFNEAIICFKKVNQLYPDSINNIYNLAWTFLKAGLTDSAIVYYNIFIDKKTASVQPFFERGYAYFIKKNYQKALSDFTKVRDLNPNNGEVYYWIAEAEYKLGNYKIACDNYETAKNKGYHQAKEKLEKYCKKNVSLGN